jgi:hypothetical protein
MRKKLWRLGSFSATELIGETLRGDLVDSPSQIPLTRRRLHSFKVSAFL